jgi:8-oxo-dGTP diphosphatase
VSRLKDKTLVYLVDAPNRRVLLGLKKRGFGAGKWNGFGGKVEEGESIRGAAVREVAEECGLLIQEADLLEVGALDFSFEEKPELLQRVHVFVALRWDGSVVESDEMAPQWFSFSQLPLESMWSSDALWLPQVLLGERISGSVVFGVDDDSVSDYRFDLNGAWH